MEKAILYENLAKLVINWDKEAFLDLIKKGLSEGVKATEIANEGLKPLTRDIFKKFKQNEIIFAEFLLMNDVLQAGMSFLLPMIRDSSIRGKNREKIVLGTVEGDVHDIGKNIVKVVLEIEGFEVIDLGKDVPVRKFIEAAEENGARIVGTSSLMTPTLCKMEELEKELKRAELKGKIRTIIGGEATSAEFAKEIGADAWAEEAVEAAQKIRELLKK